MATLILIGAIVIIYAIYKANKNKKAKANEDFAKRMEARAKRRDILFESQNPDSENYGYAPTNPIMTSAISCSEDYLKSLRTLDGKGFTWQRRGSLCVDSIGGVENVMVDWYELYLDGAEYTHIYLCPYGHSSSYVPRGLKLEE